MTETFGGDSTQQQGWGKINRNFEGQRQLRSGTSQLSNARDDRHRGSARTIAIRNSSRSR